MTDRLNYGTTAKILHWLIVALLLIQFPIGWLMPDIHGGMQPGNAMILHVSFGITILVLIVFRLIWRVTHPVAPEKSLPPWQRLTSEAIHWLLYALVLASTLTGWLFASLRGWMLTYFFCDPVADAGRREPCWRSRHRRPASDRGMGATGLHRRPRGVGAGAYFHLSRPHHAADAARMTSPSGPTPDTKRG
jgi:cytochrome b561